MCHQSTYDDTQALFIITLLWNTRGNTFLQNRAHIEFIYETWQILMLLYSETSQTLNSIAIKCQEQMLLLLL